MPTMYVSTHIKVRKVVRLWDRESNFIFHQREIESILGRKVICNYHNNTISLFSVLFTKTTIFLPDFPKGNKGTDREKVRHFCQHVTEIKLPWYTQIRWGGLPIAVSIQGWLLYAVLSFNHSLQNGLVVFAGCSTNNAISHLLVHHFTHFDLP